VSATLDKGVLRINTNADGDLVVLTTYPTTYAVQGTGLGPTLFARSTVASIRVSDAAGSTVTGCTGAGIRIAAGAASGGWSRTLGGFTVTKCGSGIDFAYAPDQVAAQAGFHGWTVSGNTVSGNSTHGVRLGADAGGLSSTSALVLSGNQVSKNANDGIRVEGTPEGLTIQGNTVVDNGRGVRDAAIRLADGRGVQRKSILVKDNVVGGADATTLSAATGIAATNMPGLRLVGNKVTSLSRGIRLTGNFKRPDTAAVLSANVVDNVDNGISLATASAVTADAGNAVTRARKAGLEASGFCVDSVLKGLSIVSTESVTADGRTGVLLDGVAGLELEAATVKGGYFGVYAKGHATNTRLVHVSVQNAHSGVFLDGISPSSGGTHGVKGLLIAGNTTIVDSKSTGLYAQGDCAGTRVYMNQVRGGLWGIHLNTASGLLVSGSAFKCSTGIRAEKACTGSTIQNSWVGNCDTAVSLESATGLLFKNHRFIDSTMGVNASGAGAGTRFEGCDFKNNASWGISLSGATGIKFIGGSVTDNAAAGLSAQGTSSGTEITGMTFSGNGNGPAVPTKSNSGIVLSATKGLTINGGTKSEGNRVHGLHAEGDCAGTTVSGSAFSKNGGAGVSLLNARGLSISGATLTGNAGNGFAVVADSTSTTIAGCNASGNTQNGMVLSSATGLTVNAGNKFESNAGNGFYATGVCTGTTVTGNTVSSNGYGGVVLVDARSLSVTKNTVGQNKSFGLYATGTATGTTVTGNTISGNNPNVFVNAVGGSFQKA
jgi:parallel beta-helix repeat protein